MSTTFELLLGVSPLVQLSLQRVDPDPQVLGTQLPLLQRLLQLPRLLVHQHLALNARLQLLRQVLNLLEGIFVNVLLAND